jgi:hypothetical protein
MIIFTTVSVVPPSINLTEIKTRSIQIDPDPHLSLTIIDTLPTTLLSRPPVFNLSEIKGFITYCSGFTAQEPDEFLNPEFNFNEIKS